MSSSSGLAPAWRDATLDVILHLECFISRGGVCGLKYQCELLKEISKASSPWSIFLGSVVWTGGDQLVWTQAEAA